MGLFGAIFGTSSERKIRKIMPLVKKINELEPSMQALSDAELRGKTQEFRDRLAKGETLDDLLPEAFAAVREAAVRTVGMRPYDVQLIGGIVLHQGRIAEMKTGEGKTLVAVLPSYLNALEGKGVYVVTVNDYLASRDASWMGKIHTFMGLTVGCIIQELTPEQRKKAYACDITYGTNSQFGFDYLRDNMAVSLDGLVQRDLNYAIIDEVDSILIDEARTPLIISGMSGETTDMYERADRFVCRLTRGEDIKKTTQSEVMMGETQEESGDYMVDQKARSVILTAEGIRKAESFFGVEDLSAPDMTELNHYIKQALTAHSLFFRDKEYIVTDDDQVMIVDQFTGRIMPGRRYSDGLHQAIEAKEGVKVKEEDKTIATITYQNYFRMFKKLAGMTGTAMTEEDEFRSIYALDVVEIPTNKPLIREDMKDVIYNTLDEKLRGIVEEIKAVHETGQPILVGTVSVEMSEIVSRLITREGIKHEVLNAKHHMREAEIVAQAGKYGKVTIATNMAGRGTDILLGGNPDFLAKRDLRNEGMDEEMIEAATAYYETDNDEILAARAHYKELYDAHKVNTNKEHEQVVAAGGLYIIGTERHESRRIDNQLRGRAGRQGDPGKTRFYVSFQDEVMVRFGGERMESIVNRMLKGDEMGAIELGVTTKLIESAQKRIEAYNFDLRKHVLEYDDVMNNMRTTIYKERRKVLDGADLYDDIRSMIRESISSKIYDLTGGNPSELDSDVLVGAFRNEFNFAPDMTGITSKMSLEQITEKLSEQAVDVYNKLCEDMDAQLAAADMEITMRDIERNILLRVVDANWMEHIDIMDQLRQGIGLRAYGNTDPLIAYREEGFNLFDSMIMNIRETTVRRLFHYKGAKIERKQAAQETHAGAQKMRVNTPREEKQKPVRAEKKVGRNDPCPCGSGKKYKNCCGKNETEN